MTDTPTYQLTIGLNMNAALSADAGHMEHQAPFSKAILKQFKRYLRVTGNGPDERPITRANFPYITSGSETPSGDGSIWDLGREQDLASGVNQALSLLSATGTDLQVQSKDGEVCFGNCVPDPRTGEWIITRAYNLQCKTSADSEWRGIDIAEATYSYINTRYGREPISSRDHRALMQLCKVSVVVLVSPAPTGASDALDISPLT